MQVESSGRLSCFSKEVSKEMADFHYETENKFDKSKHERVKLIKDLEAKEESLNKETLIRQKLQKRIAEMEETRQKK